MSNREISLSEELRPPEQSARAFSLVALAPMSKKRKSKKCRK